MLNLLKKIFGSKKAEAQPEAAPYKVEAPAPSPVAEKATEAVVKSVAPAKKAAPKKPAAPKTAKPKTPRKPKSQTKA
jgi:hypothetical protein